MTGSTQLIGTGSDDGASPVTNIGFTFNYAGTNYTQFSANANGLVRLGGTAVTTSFTNSAANANTNTPAIFPYWDDLATGSAAGGGNVSFVVNGIAPNRKLVIEWFVTIPRNTTGAANGRFQCVLEETSNIITFNYGAGVVAVTNGYSIGLATSNTVFNNINVSTNINNTATFITNNLFAIPAGTFYRFTPPVPCTGAPVAGAVTPALQNICSGTTPANLVATGLTSGVTGLTFQWEESNDDGATDAWASVVGGTGATTATYTPPVFSGSPIYYRLNVTCTNSTTSTQTSSVLVSTPATPSNQATAITIPAATVNYDRAVINWTNGNGTRRVVYISNSPTFVDPVNGNAPALVANALYSGSGQQIIFDGTGTTVTVTGLATGTQYYIKVYEYLRCGAGPFDYYYNVTTGTNIGTFTTCGVYAVPALENFTTYVPGCWQEADNGDLTAGPATFGTSSWAVDGFGNVGTAGAMRVNLDATGDNDWILSPLYSIPANYELKFDASANQWGTNPIAPTSPWEADDFVQVLVSTGTTNWTVLYTYNNTNVPSNTGTSNIIDLDAYTGQTVRFAFRGVEGATDGSADIELMVDNFELRETPSCVEPTTLTATSITSNGANLSWVDPSGIQFDYEYVVQLAGGGVPTVPGNIVDITTLPLTINTLNPATSYEFWVRANCGVDGNSAWVGPVTFRTLCNAITTLPHTEGFDAVTLPSCWTTALITGVTNWAPDDTNDGVPSSRTGARFAGKSWVGNDDALLISPVYNLAAYSTQQARLNVWIYRSANGLATDRVTFHVNTVNNLSGATMLVDIPLPITAAPVVATAGWYNYVVNIPLSFNTVGNFYILAQGRTTSSFSSYGIGFDDYVLELVPATAPSCASNVVATPNATCGNFTNSITWNASVGADGYYVTVGTTSGGTDVENALSVSATSYSFTGAIGTTYFYTIVPYNAIGSATGCTQQSFTTNANGCYCTSVPISNDASGITNVQVGTTNFPTGDVTYFDHSATTVDLARGVTSNVQVTFATGYTYNTNIWIDFDNDFTFEASELVYQGESTATNPTILNASFIMPAGAPLGLHKMRIGTADSGQATPNPCYSGSFGVTLDFNINVVAPTCVPPAATTSVVYDCANSQFSINVNVSDLGNGSPVVTNGTTNWPVTATGILNVGPFAFGTPVTLTLLHGSDAICNISLGTFNFGGCPPINDDCVNATVLIPGGVFATNPLVGTNSFATASTGAPTPACASYAGGDVWYQVTVPASGSITIETNNNSSAITDTGLAIYSGTCGSLTSVGCDDDSSLDGAFSLVSLTGRTPGEVLYVRVWEYGGGTEGTFRISAYDASLSSGSFDNANFSAYPNPVKDILNVSYSTEISSIRVINMIGQEVISKNINATSTQVDMSQLSAGTYIVNVTVGDNVKTLKVVKQ